MLITKFKITLIGSYLKLIICTTFDQEVNHKVDTAGLKD